MDRKDAAIAVLVAVLIGPLVLTGYTTSQQSPGVGGGGAGPPVEPGSMTKPCNFQIYLDGSKILSNNCQTGANTYSGTVFSTVLQNTIDDPSTPRSIFVKDGSYAVSARITPRSGLELWGVWGRTRLISDGITAGDAAMFQTSAAVTDLSIHDFYVEGKYFTTFPTIRSPTTDSFAFLITGGLAENVHIYNMWIKNFAAGVFINGGGATGTSRNWNFHDIIGEEFDTGILAIRSQSTIVYNIRVAGIQVDKFRDGGIEFAATNGGISTLGGEMYGITVSDVNLYNGFQNGLAFNSVEPVSTNGNKMHSINVNNVEISFNREYAGITGLGLDFRVSGAGGNAVYDFNVNNLHVKDADTGIQISNIQLGGKISNFMLEDVRITGILVDKSPLPTYNPLLVESGTIKLHSAATRGILLQSLTGSSAVTGVRFDDVKIQGTGTQLAIQHTYVGTGSISDIDYRRMEWAPGTLTVNFTVASDLTIRDSPSYITENWGATSVADGGTISHGLAGTVDSVTVTCSIASQICGVTALAATTFTVSIKTDTGAAGTTQTVYWYAVFIP